jgi:hypothetical protein
VGGPLFENRLLTFFARPAVELDLPIAIAINAFAKLA